MKFGHKTSDFSPLFRPLPSYILHLEVHLPSSIKHQTSSDCTGGRTTTQFDTASQNKFEEICFYDKIDNTETYSGLSEDIRLGLEWIRDVNPGVEDGVHELSSKVKAIVSEYTTKEVNENGYEAHHDYVDIQYLISGEEYINSSPLDYLNEISQYNKDIDAAFYDEADIKPQKLLLGNGYFVILFPQDGHMPQLCVDKPKQ